MNSKKARLASAKMRGPRDSSQPDFAYNDFRGGGGGKGAETSFERKAKNDSRLLSSQSEMPWQNSL